MIDFMRILVKRILKALLEIYDGFCVAMGFPYELLVLVKRSLIVSHVFRLLFQVINRLSKYTDSCFHLLGRTTAGI